MKIVCVCGMGLGSSVIAKMNVQEVMSSLGIDAVVETCDLGSVRAVPADYYLTTRELADSLPDEVKDRVITLTNFVLVSEVRNALTAVLGHTGEAR